MLYKKSCSRKGAAQGLLPIKSYDTEKEQAEKRHARNTFVTPVFEQSGKDWESLKTIVLLQMLIKLVVKNVIPKEAGIKRKRDEGKNVKC